MSWRPLIVTAAMALALLVGSVVGARAATPQERADDTAAWLSRVLLIPIEPRPVSVTTAMLSEHADAEATAEGVIHVRASRGLVRDRLTLTYVLLHETLHAPRNAACWGWIDEAGAMSPERRIEEGITEALTLDLLPALQYRRFGIRWPARTDTVYSREVSDVRYTVRRLTGGRGWGRAERLKLRELWAASCDGRVAMLAEVAR